MVASQKANVEIPKANLGFPKANLAFYKANLPFPEANRETRDTGFRLWAGTRVNIENGV
jgi:hypothetical protein